MANVVVTGALGHIGSRFIREISPAVAGRVDLLDNMLTQRYASLFNLPGEITYRFFEDDICTADLESYFHDIDIVVHLAAITNAEGSFAIRKEVERTNLEGTRRVAEACVRCGCKLVFLSTTSVYGTQQEIVDENCSAEELKPQSPYAESKLNAERLLQEKGQRDGLQFIICRFGTIFGTSIGMRFHTAINKFIWLAATGRPLTVWRTAIDQQRPYLDLGDAINALNFILEKDLFDRRVYNVLTANATVREIVDVISLYMPNIQVAYVDSPIMNQLSYTVSSQRFKDQGFRYSGSLRQGIYNTVRLLQGISSAEQLYNEVASAANRYSAFA
jgi:UDP-glucose 4-epimerase